MYTPEQTAEMLQIAPSTLRKYSRLYHDHLSPSANRKQRKFTEADIATLQKVVQMRAEGVSLAEIPGQLVTVQPEEVTIDNSLALIPAIATELQSLHDQISQLQASQDEKITALQSKLDQLTQELEQIKTPWYKRIFPKK